MSSFGPYFTTALEVDVRVHPSQMDNNIVDHIRTNLQRSYLNKIYENYGYIDKILEVDNNIKGGVIRAEDNTSSSVHRVKFQARICNPIRNTIISGQITSINNMMIIAQNGPVRFIIDGSTVNTDNIQYRKSAFYPVSPDGSILDKPIEKGTYVMIRVMSKKLVKNKKIIFVIGRLEYVVPDDKIKDVISEQYTTAEYIDSNDLAYDRIRSKSEEIEPDMTEESEESEDNDDND